MGYMGFGMQRWIYTMKPRKFRKYQAENTGHEILGYKNTENQNSESIDKELRSVEGRIEESKRRSVVSIRMKIFIGIVIFIGFIALLYFTQVR